MQTIMYTCHCLKKIPTLQNTLIIFHIFKGLYLFGNDFEN